MKSWVVSLKKCHHIWNQRPRIYQNAKVCAKIKILKFGLERPFFSIFRLQFGKANVIFEINTLEFIQIPNIGQNSDNSNNKKWNKKMPYLGILVCKFEKLLLCLQSTSSNLSKYRKKKCSKEKKNLGPKMLYMCILGCKFEKPLIYLKSASLNLLKCNVLCKNQSP